MNLNSIKRLFKRRNKPAAPQIEGDADFSEQILKVLQASGAIPASAEVRVRHERVAPPERPGIKPPTDDGTEGWTWSRWCQEIGPDIPGWAFCRFANRLGQEDVGFVFGHVRGGFGVWKHPFEVCATTEQGLDQRSEILTCITHLRSGLGVGVFADHTTAVAAAELADKVCPNWHGDTEPFPGWRANLGRTLEAWRSLGICESTNAHAHDRHGTRFPIYGHDTESLMAGKPERLS